ncbi:[F-actin]-monooxygenase mical3 [Boothiomyces sp. JEL0866]|nr:[F-actin]-monooxygenase mical3 [Boothiomyces sp. JEL0866]
MDMKSLFDAFIASDSVPTCLQSFDMISDYLVGYTFKKIALESQHNLIAYLGKRMTENTEKNRIVVSGAGPIGLRCAIESAFLGHKVTLIEKESEFNDFYYLALWKETESDFNHLGLFESYPDKKPLFKKDIQLGLLKIALLAGVDVRFGTVICGIKEKFVWTLPTAKSAKFFPQKPTVIENGMMLPDSDSGAIRGNCPLEFDAQIFPLEVLIVAEGESSSLVSNLGFQKKVSVFTDNVTVLIHYEKPKERQPLKVPQGFTYESVFKVCGKSEVMMITTRLSALLACKVLQTRKLDSINQQKLDEFCRIITQNSRIHSVKLYDSSIRTQLTESSKIVENVLVLPVGDALLSQYWPLDLGINRGIHNGLDAVWAGHLYPNHEQELEFCQLMNDSVGWQYGDRPRKEYYEADPKNRYDWGKYAVFFKKKALLPDRYL